MKNITNKKKFILLPFFMMACFILSATIIIEGTTDATNGNCDGSIELTTIGSAGPFNIVIELSMNGNGTETVFTISNFSGTQTIPDLCAGIYDITVFNSFLCETNLTTQILGCEADFSINPSTPQITPASDCQSPNGSIEYFGTIPLSITGTAPHNWSWSTGQSGNYLYNIYNLSAGIYSLTITDANGCTSEYNHEVGSDSDQLIGGITNTTNISNGCDGGFDIVVIGDPPYTLTLQGVGNTTTTQGSSENFNFTGLCQGNYNIVVSDANGCQLVFQGTIEGCPTITVSQPVISNSSGCGSSDGIGSGTIEFVNGAVTGGNPPYTYLWSNGANTLSVTNAGAGTHTLIVTDENGCTGEFSYNVGVGEPQSGSSWANLAVSQVVNDATGGCNGNGVCSGSATVLYDYYGSSYSFRVRLTGNGQNQEVVHIKQPGQFVQQLYDVSHTFEGLCEGTYTITSFWFTPQWSYCSIEQTITITSTPEFMMAGSPQIIKPSNCNATNGSIQYNYVSNPVNGSAPYLWFWSNGDNTPNAIENLSPGNYSVTVIDNNGCIIEDSFDLTVPNEAAQITYTTVQPDAGVEPCNGSVTITGIPGMILTLDDGSGNTVSGAMDGTAFNFSQLCASDTDYTLTVVDAGGCSSSYSFNLTGCPKLDFGAVIFQQPSTCESFDGIIRILGGAGGGTAPYQFDLINENGTMITPSGVGWHSLGEGTYTVRVEDAAECYDEFDYELVSSATPMVLGVDIKRECEDLCNGYIALAILGGSGNYIHEVTFLGNGGNSEPCLNWNVGETMTFTSETVFEDLINLESGNYHIVTTDIETGCSIEENYFVGEIPSTGEFMVVGEPITTKSCPEQPTGTISFEVAGGFPPYTVTIDNPNDNILPYVVEHPDETSPFSHTFEEVYGGSYTLTVEDRPECGQKIEYNEAIIVDEFPIMVLNYESIEDCPGESKIEYFMTGGVPPFNLTWTGPNTNEGIPNVMQNQQLSLNDLYEGFYTLMATDAEGCTKTFSVFVTQFRPPFFSGEITINYACSGVGPAGEIGEIMISNIIPDSNNPMQPVVTFQNNQNGEILFQGSVSSSQDIVQSNLTTGTYTLTIDDGCIENLITETYTIEEGVIDDTSPYTASCFNRVYCNGNGIEQNIQIGIKNVGVQSIGNGILAGDCAAQINCNNLQSIPISGNATFLSYSGGSNSSEGCDCNLNEFCTISENYVDAVTFTDVNEVPHSQSQVIPVNFSGTITTPIPNQLNSSMATTPGTDTSCPDDGDFVETFTCGGNEASAISLPSCTICNPDADGDMVIDNQDNCPTLYNPGIYQAFDCDGDGIGDVCDTNPDEDADGIADNCDNCTGTGAESFFFNPSQSDCDGDGIGDGCEEVITDIDGDGVDDNCDNCTGADGFNPHQFDCDGNGIGDACDPSYPCSPNSPGTPILLVGNNTPPNIESSLRFLLDRKEISNEEIVVYPNPFHNEINITVDGKKLGNSFTVKLYNLFGKILLEEYTGNVIGEKSFVFYPDINIPNGVYYMRLEDKNGKITGFEIVKFKM